MISFRGVMTHRRREVKEDIDTPLHLIVELRVCEPEDIHAK